MSDQYADYTEENILNTEIASVSSGIDTSEGSVTRNVLSPPAGVLAQAYINLGKGLDDTFPQTTTIDTTMDFWAGLVGLTRKQGSQATGAVTFTGTNGVTIPTGTQVQTSGGLVYATTSNTTISDTTANASVQAVAIGESYNVPSGTVNSLPVSITGVISVTNASAITGGSDVESSADLYIRFSAKASKPSTSGNANDYYKWAMSVSGIGNAKILPLWNGNGTVKVVLIDTDKQPANSTLVSNVQTYTEALRPIGASVTYEAATGLSINVSATLALASGYTVEGVTPAIEAAIAAYLKGIAFSNNMGKILPTPPQDYVSAARIGDAILNVPGVNDYSSLMVNSGTSNITVPVEDVAILGTVTLS